MTCKKGCIVGYEYEFFFPSLEYFAININTHLVSSVCVVFLDDPLFPSSPFALRGIMSSSPLLSEASSLSPHHMVAFG